MDRDVISLAAILMVCLALAILAVCSSVGSHVEWGTLAETGSAIFTALFTAILAWVGFRQEKISRSQADIAENQLELMKQQTDISIKQKEIARQGQLATHRPRLAVRNVALQPKAKSWPGQPMFTVGEVAEGTLYVVNRGGSTAWITNALVIVHQQQNQLLPMSFPYQGSNGKIGRMDRPLLAGQAVAIPIPSMQKVGQDKAVDILRGKLPDHLYVMGWVEYQDGMYDQETDSQLTRRTAFCRKFDIDTKRFVRVQDDDYEYEE